MTNDVLGPFDQQDLRRTIPSDGNGGPAEPAIHIQPVPSHFIQSADLAAAARWQPERGQMRRPPLAAMTMAGEDQIKVVPVVEESHDIRRMGQEQGEAVRMRRWHLVETGAME